MAKKAAKKKVSAKKKRGATPSSGNKAPVPGWVWLVTGILAGLFIAFLAFLQTREEAPTPAAVPPPQPVKPAESNIPPEAKPAPEEKSRFEFYDILPQLEVLVPEEEEPRPEAPGQAPQPVTKKGRYVLQSGSFRQWKDADRRRANLALLGVESRIQKVKVNDKDTWHRVRVGPFKKLDDLNEVRALLHDNDIDTLLIRIKE